MLWGMSRVEHETAVQQKLTERYLLNELDADARNEFEEHFFDCPECAFDVQAGVAFIDHSKSVLDKAPEKEPMVLRPPDPGWLAWLRPAFAAPALALLLAVFAYQNLVTLPGLQKALNQPQVLPWVSVNIRTLGSGAAPVTMSPGQEFLMFVRIPPESGYIRYSADLYDPEGKLESSLSMPASSEQDVRAVRVPAAKRQSGTYTLAVRGVTNAGESKEVGRGSFELQVQ
jgi:hypothetical protein